MSDVRDGFLNAALGSELVETEFGPIEVREMSIDQVGKLFASLGDSASGGVLSAELLIATCYDPDTGKPVFDKQDRDTLMSKPPRVFEGILPACRRAAGLGRVDAPKEENEGSS